jgi:DNA-binding transcriptional ArsR family regulator
MTVVTRQKRHARPLPAPRVLDKFLYGNIFGDMARAATTSDSFNAIAEPRRRHILEFLAVEERSVGEIADALALNQPSVSKHLHVLLDVGLVHMRRHGRQTMYRTNPDPLREIHEWSGMFARYWRGQLRRIKAHAEEKR